VESVVAAFDEFCPISYPLSLGWYTTIIRQSCKTAENVLFSMRAQWQIMNLAPLRSPNAAKEGKI